MSGREQMRVWRDRMRERDIRLLAQEEKDVAKTIGLKGIAVISVVTCSYNDGLEIGELTSSDMSIFTRRQIYIHGNHTHSLVPTQVLSMSTYCTLTYCN